ncbi:MAG: hypothetical protein GY697_20405, partial [Desulfobacterales bacterium]|nr:hypothetical protein [Desulfobacterales bacterium]
FDRFSDILSPNEKVIWQGSPSALQAWSDHDMMEPAGSVGDRPGSLMGRRAESILAVMFILFLSFAGAGSIYSGGSEILQKQEPSTYMLDIFLILLGITLMSGLPFLLRPVSNCLRTRQLTYLLTPFRAVIIRRGHALAEIWVRSPVIFSASLLFLYGVFMFSWIFIQGAHQDFLNGAGVGTWLARGCSLIFIGFLGFVFSTIGFIGLRFQTVIILDAIKDRHGQFVRSFGFNEINRNDFPVVTRLRKNGVGDVILGQDGHWEYYGDSNITPDFKINAVGFLSVPEAKMVSDMIQRMIEPETVPTET